MQQWSPHTEILPAAQRQLWDELSAVPAEFTLYRGTATALHLGHRNSVDFDFFGHLDIDVSALESKIPFLAGAQINQRERNTLTAIVERGDPVQVSFFGVPKLPRVAPALIAKDNQLRIASLLDLAGTKASVLQVRAELKDYVDIDALIHRGGVGLPTALAAAQKLYGDSFNPEITLKALSYFDDGNLRDLPDDVKLRLVSAVRAVNLDHLPTLECSLNHTRDEGYGL